MSGGPNQHYIPSFLQRAFGIVPRRLEIWRFGVDKSPKRGRIKKTGSARYFYSEPTTDGRATLDDAITAMELKLSRDLREVGSKSPGEHVDAGMAASIVSHLGGRTAHVRSTLGDMLAGICERSESLFAEPGNVERMMGLDANAPTARFRELVAGDLARMPADLRPGVPPRLLERVAFVLGKESRGNLLEGSQALVATMIEGIRAQSGEVVREAHNKGLDQARSVSADAYERSLGEFEWVVECAPAGGAILPDCVVIAFDKDGKAGSHLLVGGKNVRAVVMAISTEKLLVGCSAGVGLPKGFEFNAEAARLSHSFFLSARNDKEMSWLQALIGERLRVSVAATTDAAFEERQGKSDGDRQEQGGQDAGAFGWRPTLRAQYELSLVGCGDAETSQRMQKEVAGVVEDVAGAIQLERLDGITVGSDYPALLRGLERGFEGGPAVETVSPEVGVGIAKTVMVERSGVIKGHVVMSSVVGAALISEDSEDAGWGVHVLVKLLARVALIGIVDDALPGRLLAPVDGEIDAWLYKHVDGVPDEYVASKLAGKFGDSREIGDGLRELLVNAIERLRIRGAEGRRAYRSHGDLSQLLGAVLPEIGHVLVFAADLLGHCTSSGETRFDDRGVLTESLEKAGLLSWFEVYGEHLESFDSRLGRWESFEEFLAFNLHVERLLWSVGVFAWENPQGVRIAVADDFDPGGFAVAQSGS